jgi:hypothetical protein
MEINGVVKNAKRASLVAVIKEIDTFRKLNVGFKPFKVMKINYADDLEVLEVSAIRSDGKFVVQDKWCSEQLSKEDMQKYGT